jgi:hypothetical protein
LPSPQEQPTEFHECPGDEPALNQAELAAIAKKKGKVTERILAGQRLEAQTITTPPPPSWLYAIAIAGIMIGVVYLLDDAPSASAHMPMNF